MNQKPVGSREDLRRRFLVLRAQVGDEQAFTELYRTYNPRTLRYLAGLLDGPTARDVHQDVWITVYNRISTLANPGGFRTWLYQITRRKAVDELRRQKRTSELLDPVADDAMAIAATNVHDVSATEMSPEMEAALGTLSAAHREVLMLSYWEEMTYAQIALVVSCSIGTVRSRIHHAKLKLTDALANSLH